MKATVADDAATRCTIGRNRACSACRYTLRGLTPPGRCPECGADIDASIEAERERQRMRSWTREELERRRDRARAKAKLPPAPHEARHAAEGCLILLLAAAPILAFAASPDAWERRGTPRRRTLLIDLSVAWVLAGYGAVKLGRVDKARREEDPFSDSSGRLLTGCAVAYALAPVVGRLGDNWAGEVMVLVAVPGLALSLLLPLRLRVLAKRVRHARLAREAAFLAVFTPLWLLLIVSDEILPHRAAGSSLHALTVLPQFPFGQPGLYRAILHPIPWAPWDVGRVWVSLAVLAIVCWNASVLLRLALAHVPYLRPATGGDASPAQTELREASHDPLYAALPGNIFAK